MANSGTIKSSFKVTRSTKIVNQKDGSKQIATPQTQPMLVLPIEPQEEAKTRKRSIDSTSKASDSLQAPKRQAPSTSTTLMPPPPAPLDIKIQSQLLDLLRGRIVSSTSSVASRNTEHEEGPSSKEAGPSRPPPIPRDLGPMPLRPSLSSAHDELVMLMDRVAKEEGMTASLLLLGERGVGKTLVVESALRTILSSQKVGGDQADKVIGVVRLSGLIHLDERNAFQEVARQLCDEFHQVFSRTASYDENLVFLRTMLQALHRCLKAVVFVIDEIDAFTRKGKQTLLYNLLDTLSHSKVQACVIGVSSVVDVMDSMEKRVRSRFSHRRIVLQPPQYFEAKVVDEAGPSTSDEAGPSTSASASNAAAPRDDKGQKEGETPLAILRSILTLPLSSSSFFPRPTIEAHNASVSRCLDDPAVKIALSQSFNVKLRPSDLTGIAQRILHEWAVDLLPATAPFSNLPTSSRPPPVQPLSPGHALRAIHSHQQIYTSQIKALVDCSVLQMFLVVAMHRVVTAKGQDACNFEMTYDEMRRCVMAQAGAGGAEQYRWGKPVALRAFQGLVGNGLVAYSSSTGERHAGRGSAFMGAELRAGKGTIEASLRARGDEGCPDLLTRFFNDI